MAWFDENGFDVVLEKQHVSKSIFSVSKHGVFDKFELSQGIKDIDIAQYMASTPRILPCCVNCNPCALNLKSKPRRTRRAKKSRIN